MADVENHSSDGVVNEVSENISISRGMRPDVVIEFSSFRDLFVFDELGSKIRFGDVFKNQKTIVIFVRHFLDFISKEYVEDLALIPIEYLQEANTRLVVIGPARHNFIKSFRKDTGYQYMLYCDPDRKVYKALGLIEKLTSGKLGGSKHIKSGFVMGVLRSTWRAMNQESRQWQGDVSQQGGAFVFGPGEVVHFQHIDQSSTDHVAISDVLAAAGVRAVSFPKDPRIQNL